MGREIRVTLQGQKNITVFKDGISIYSSGNRELGKQCPPGALTLNHCINSRSNPDYTWYPDQKELFKKWYQEHYNNTHTGE